MRYEFVTVDVFTDRRFGGNRWRYCQTPRFVRRPDAGGRQ